MGVAFLGLKENQQAIEAIRRSVKIGPAIPVRWAGLGILLAQSPEPAEARKWLCKAWQARSSLSEGQIQSIIEALETLGVDPATCAGEE